MEDLLAECPICLDQPKNPTEHRVCHKLFCTDCLKPLYTTKAPRCPYCRELLDQSNPEIDELEVGDAEVLKYSCPLCEEEALDCVNLIVHIEDNHYEASGDCPICQKNGSEEVYHEDLMSHLRDFHDFDYEMYQEHMDLSEEELLAEIIERSRLDFAS